MLSLGVLSFAVPWALAALAALPVIWWLLRLTPPAPHRLRFPPVRLLLALVSRQESTATSPPWLLILRLALAGAVIFAAAHPLLNASAAFRGAGPLVLLIDDGWAAAMDWPARQTLVANLLDQAEREDRMVVTATTAPVVNEAGALVVNGADEPIAPVTAVAARAALQGLEPKPWPVDRQEALDRLSAAAALDALPPGQAMWLSDGLHDGEGETIVQELRRFGAVTVFADPPERSAVLLRLPSNDGDALVITAARASDGAASVTAVTALGDDGRPLARQAMTFETGEKLATARLVLPAELRNRLARLRLDDAGTAGGVVLLDERWRRRPVGLVSAEGTVGEQPLLSDQYYLERALDPYTELRRGTVGDLLKRPLAVMILIDPGPLEDGERGALEQWIVEGGVVVRFAGPRLAQDSDVLLPVPLRDGDRVLGGALSWGRPATMAPIDDASPLHGIEPGGNIRIRRQVLAQPSIDLAEKTWARLSDGTPLVSAEKRGKGWLILVHTTANTAWSDLALSGTYVAMLRRFVGLSRGVTGAPSKSPLAPLRTLDGFGRLGPPPITARAVPGDGEETVAGPRHPPGYYGAEDSRRALNLTSGLADPESLPAFSSEIAHGAYGQSRERDLRPWFLVAALVLAIADMIASLALRRLLILPGAAAVLALLMGGFSPAGAAEDDNFFLTASLKTRLAYVITGERDVDEVSRAGLWGLSVIVNRRTAAELAEPMGIDPADHELSFFPLLYWPITDSQPPPSPTAVANLNEYVRNGGTILFDTRDGDGGSNSGAMRGLVAGMDLPPLVPLPADHVLGRAYYLLRELPGRFTGGTVWVQRAGARINDGVSPVIVGPHDWAAAWAMDDAQRPLFAVVPGGERQREWSYRAGINLIMYTLTGNYKADQVHLPAIINRLGQ